MNANDKAGPPADGYLHGGDPSKDMARLGLTLKKVTDFSTNLNPLGIPPVIRDHWPELLDAVRDYPSVEGNGIARFYRERFGIHQKNILPGNGSTELIYLIYRVMRPGRVLIISPSFHDYYRAAVLAGADVALFHLSEDNEFTDIDPAALTEACKDVDAIWIGRPNNPTGAMIAREILTDLCGMFPDKWFILDEAFIQFIDNWEEETFMFGEKPDNLIVIHSLTKFYGLAGLRMGGVIAGTDIILKIRSMKEPWTINGIAERAAPMLMECADYESETRAYISFERERIIGRLNKARCIRAFTSKTNFILCKWTRTGNLDDLLSRLLKNRLYVRDCRNFTGLKDNYFRIGLRTREENELLISVIES
ncbi:MAG: threonine-phosphate decarboxylase [Deltaproteobacteria bacterium]|nr:threonine-phosphate decarboxylase [Deltaproteobacteria bacterium]